jgi:hypothetical protein
MVEYAVQEHEGYGQAFVFSADQQLDWSDLLYLTIMPTEKRKMKFWVFLFFLKQDTLPMGKGISTGRYYYNVCRYIYSEINAAFA